MRQPTQCFTCLTTVSTWLAHSVLLFPEYIAKTTRIQNIAIAQVFSQLKEHVEEGWALICSVTKKK